MPIELEPLHRHLKFLSPLSESRADGLVRFVASRASGTVVDAGCGWAELLLRVLEFRNDIRGIGVDLHSEDFAHAYAEATARGVANRVELIAADARLRLPASAGGAICIGASQIWGAPAEARQPLDYRAALTALRALLVPGSPLVYGEGIWSTSPTEAAAAPLAGRLDEYVFLADLVDLAWECGFTVMQVHEASLDEWDAFESGFAARYAVWLAAHSPSHPEAADVLARARRQRDAYFRGYRGVLGMAYLALIAA